MSDFTLTASAPLGGYDRRFGDLHLREVTDLAILSATLPLGQEAAGEKALARALGVGPPPVAQAGLSANGKTRLARLGRDQFFVLIGDPGPDPLGALAETVGDALYCTDQSDVWVALELTGAGARPAVERICPIDLHADVFAIGAVARTVMEHLATIITRTEADSFLLLSATSSGASFLHALETSITNTQ